MAKVSMIERDKKRKKINTQQRAKREALKEVIMNKETPIEERFEASLLLAELKRDGSKSRQRNRCRVTGRPRGYYRKFNMSRIALRDLASLALIPGVTKSSW